MKRIEFRLSMPSRGSWDGGWSGEGQNYTIVRNLTDKRAAALLREKSRKSWGYNFGDGWFASIEAHVVPKGERVRASNGFCGYDWMVRSILADGDIYGPTKPKPGQAVEDARERAREDIAYRGGRF